MPDEIRTASDVLADHLLDHPEVGPAIELGLRMLEAAKSLPDDSAVTDQERELVLKLEAEVDAAFGPDSRLYGRCVALYAVRDLLRG